MSANISSINYCPVKSVSFQTIENCEIKKDIGIINDRIFKMQFIKNKNNYINNTRIDFALPTNSIKLLYKANWCYKKFL